MNEISSLKALETGLEIPVGLPHSIEAEQQLLGAILTNNDLFERVAPIVEAEHFMIRFMHASLKQLAPVSLKIIWQALLPSKPSWNMMQA